MFVAFVIQDAMLMLRIILSFVACPAVQYFSTLSHERHDFRKTLLNIEHVLIFSSTFVWNFLILRKNERRVIKNVYLSSCKVPLFLSDFNGTWILATGVWRVNKLKISCKSTQWEPSCSMRKDRQTCRRYFTLMWPCIVTNFFLIKPTDALIS